MGGSSARLVESASTALRNSGELCGSKERGTIVAASTRGKVSAGCLTGIHSFTRCMKK